ncbi:MAG: hypothetical protein Kow0069_05980 [Promethearchaeota archaeon]
MLKETGPVARGLHLVDLNMFGFPHFGTAFVLHFEAPDGGTPTTVVVDSGTSDDVAGLRRYLRRAGVPTDGHVLLVPSHHHFDHAGGTWRLYEVLAKNNPRTRVVTTASVRDFLQDPEEHLQRARTTFGNFVGRMKPLPEDAYDVVRPGERVEIPGDPAASDAHFVLVPTPGHTPDHVSPAFYYGDGERAPKFCFFGEACGTIYNEDSAVTLATTMPPHFEWDAYLDSLAVLRELGPEVAGFCHYGGVSGREDVRRVVDEHEAFMVEFRRRVLEAYEEKPETSHVVEKIHPWFVSRTNFAGSPLAGNGGVFWNMSVALTYGMLVALGLRERRA